jgi:outer membrane protein assembly factor BamB
MSIRPEPRLLLRALLVATLLAGSAGCSWIKSLGDSDDEEEAELEPAELVDFEPEIEVREEWSRGIGNGQGKLFNRLQPAVYGDMIIAASANGTVEAIDAATGKTRWDVDVDTDLSGGVGAGGDLVVVGTDRGVVIALESASGRELWRATVSGELLAPPAADWDVVVVQTLDGKLHGLETSSGARRWTHDSSMPLLTLRGTSAPVLQEGVAYAGLANGRVIALKADAGTLLWEGRVATPQGQSDIERAVDIDGRPLIDNGVLYAVSYQGKVGALQLANGRPLWLHDASSYVGVASGFGNVYVAETTGVLSAYETDGGALRWQNDQLLRRQLSAPAAIGSYVAVADFEGYLHFLSQVDGHIVARERADSDGVRADMIVHDGKLYVYGNDGELSCFSIAAP